MVPLKPVPKGWKPELWASWRPFGFGLQKPNNFFEVFRAGLENADNAAYAWRILNDGVCDGCALGTYGLRDWTIRGIHLCNVRLRLLRLNTMGPLEVGVLAHIEELRRKSSAELRALGRLPYPMRRKRGEPGFSRISWDEALDRIGLHICKSSPERLGFYLTSRGTPNETYYAAQKAVRALGSNNIDNAARICHSPSTVALKESLGVAATTCSYTDLIGTDLIVFFGSNPAVNQPVLMKYLYYARKAGTQVVCVNPYKEPAMDRYWVPSDPESALFGTRITDRFFLVAPGGDLAFITGALKALLEQDGLNQAFIAQHTRGFEALEASLRSARWAELETGSGLSQAEMTEFAQMLRRADKAVLVWSMGITQHSLAEDTVQAIINLALARGYLGREGCGLMPIRGHSGVQGGAEMGAYATVYPGGLPITPEHAAALEQQWGFPVPTTPGLTAPEMLDRAAQGQLDLLWSVGGNFLETLPDPLEAAEALSRVPLRVHQDIVLSSQMLVEGEEVILLPATTRYEVPGGVSETSTERRVIFSPEIPGPRIGEARPEYEALLELARRCRPDLADRLRFENTAAIRAEIVRVIPLYDGIQHLHQKGQAFQYGGPHLCPDGVCPTPDGRARFKALGLPSRAIPSGAFRLATRRGKQFNSMVHEPKDPISGAERDAVLVSLLDAARLKLYPGQPVWLRNEFGVLPCRVFLAEIRPGTLQVYWPEGNVLLDPKLRSPQAKVPAYKESYVYLETQNPSGSEGQDLTAAR
ncbi:FdhF/YdeP family oxidoreductase [Meiothermus granaticius]|uniref:FdhF/YdeP family oxidoreductase n=1 Tax=Meiothermus granaticius TaxID=863370 RepID=UPI000E64C777|nr:FdhF/YdeP family oxidoreductase [Meiothermus granaticius]GEM87823.1 formate dehydrogenase [Meiothermus granaticius NBRC 107808]